MTVTLAIPTISANAASLQNKNVAQPTIAILDTALDTSLPIFKDKILFEACVTQWSSCPNGLSEMEGTNSSTLKPEWISKNGFDHGTQIASIAVATNPNVKIVFIRYSNVTASGSSANRPESLVAAIDWVSKNSDKYSIDALSISQAAVDTGNLSRCNVNSPNFDNVTTGAVSLLNAKNIPVFVATGNHARSDVIGWPACTPGAIGVGALTTATSLLLEKATNRGPGLDIVTFGALEIYKGTIPTAKFNLSGSSGATVVSATTYLKNNTYKTFQEYFNALPKIVINTVSYSRN